MQVQGLCWEIWKIWLSLLVRSPQYLQGLHFVRLSGV